MNTYNKENPQSIRLMFNAIARQYDRTNAILSFRMHKHWNRTLINKAVKPVKPKVILDLCCGTGAIAFEILKNYPNPIKVFMLDFSEQMLECAQAQAKIKNIHHHNINYLQADAQEIPLLENSIDCVTLAYGIRNIMNPTKCLKEVYRVLRPHGTFGILELTQPSNPVIRFFHTNYLNHILPFIGKLVTSNPEAYQYLCSSIKNFIPTKTLVEMMEKTGFKNIKTYSLCFGVATIFIGTKD